ncbi:hypothetical protein [Rhodanobacter hydrolyticus]|uniref:Uncharacterized protein n=1 Tax=Rhodanobacter hydrolyticus TaxID=2250595 RepID=A0ABW8J6E6_9GAMM
MTGWTDCALMLYPDMAERPERKAFENHADSRTPRSHTPLEGASRQVRLAFA